MRASKADAQHIPSVLIINSSGGGVAGTLDSNYYKGAVERQGTEREYVIVISESNRKPDGE